MRMCLFASMALALSLFAFASQILSAPPDAALEGFGALSESSGGAVGREYRYRYPYLLENGRLLVVGFAEYPGKPLSASFAVVVRLPSKNAVHYSFRSSNKEAGHSYLQKFDAAGGASLPLHFQVEGETWREKLSLAEKDYALEQGRAFALDLTATPPTVTQVKADLGKLFPEAQPSREEFRGALEKLREQQPAVQALFAE